MTEGQLISKRRKDIAAWAVKNFKTWPKPYEIMDADPEEIGCELVVYQHPLPVLRCKLGGGYVDSTTWFYAKKRAAARDVERWIGIGKAIERACMDLPDGTEISVSLEKDAGTVTLIDQNLRGKPRGSARGSSEQAGTACGATSVASGQLACEVQQGQPHQPLPTAMLLGE